MSQKPYKILIVDSDPSSLMFLDVNLSKFGYEVLTSETTEEGLLLANREMPSVIICDVQSKNMDGMEFCWIIRETSKVRSVPFILLTTSDNPETHINGYRSGVDAFVVKPVSMRVLITRIETLIWRVEQIQKAMLENSATPAAEGEAAPDADLAGKITSFSIIELMQFANMSKKTGRLVLRKGEEMGEIGIREGEVTFARIGELVGEEALYRMAGWQEGTFQFRIDQPPEESNIQKPTMKLILDCCSVLDMENIIVKKG